MLNKIIFFMLVIFFICGSIWSQEFGFGFWFDDEDTEKPGAAGDSFLTFTNNKISASVNGQVSASLVGYFDDFYEGADHIQFGDIFSGKLNFSAKTSFAEGIINLNITTTEMPVNIDEAYLRAFFGNFEISAGLRKITWGKADSFGSLDVINPLDSSKIFTEMADNTTLMGVRIPRPLVHASFRFGMFSKIEGLFVPNFEPTRFDTEGKWAPAQMQMMELASEMDIFPKTNTIDYAQAGFRFTTTIGSSDMGVQYYYGRLTQPAVKIDLPSVAVDYNKYHQIGLDYAQVLFGFNLRAEFAANITEDLKGDDRSVYNPSLAWSFGFDRDLFWGINLNLQVNESIRLMNKNVGSKNIVNLYNDMNSGNEINFSNYDIEGDSPVTATRLTAALSKKFLKDALEFRASVVWGIEDMDCAIIPALIWTKDDFKAALSAGIFAGDSKGQLGQYKDNNFIKISLTYTF